MGFVEVKERLVKQNEQSKELNNLKNSVFRKSWKSIKACLKLKKQKSLRKLKQKGKESEKLEK